MKGIFLTVLSSICLVLGLITPAFLFSPTLGDPLIDIVLASFIPDFRPTQFSLLRFVVKLLKKGELPLGIVLLSFAVLFPIAKLTTLYSVLLFNDRFSRRASKLLSTVGYWSMLDVFVIAVLVASFKEFPGGTRVVPLMGTYFFAASVLLSMLASLQSKRLLQDATPPCRE